VFAYHNYLSCPLPGELIEDMEASSDTSTGLLDTTKDTSNMGAKEIAEETGIAACTNSELK